MRTVALRNIPLAGWRWHLAPTAHVEQHDIASAFPSVALAAIPDRSRTADSAGVGRRLRIDVAGATTVPSSSTIVRMLTPLIAWEPTYRIPSAARGQ